jgi:hypothetical protein
VGGAAVAVTPYIGVVAAAPHGGRSIPPWPMAGAALTVVARGGRLSWAPLLAADRWRPLAAVGHGGFLANRRGARRLVVKSAKISNGRIISQNDIYIKCTQVHSMQQVHRPYLCSNPMH